MEPATAPEMIHWFGDTWVDGLTGIGPIEIEGSPPASPCGFCRIQFFKEYDNGVPEYELNSNPGQGQGRLVIEDSAAYRFSRPAQDLPLSAGAWHWVFQTFTGPGTSGERVSWLRGILRVKVK